MAFLPRTLQFLINPNRGLPLAVAGIGLLLWLIASVKLALVWFTIVLMLLSVSFILVSAILPPPRPFRESTILSKFVYQILQTTWKGLMVGVAAYLGALVSIEIQQATTKPENTFQAFMASVSGTLPMVILIALMGGFFIFLMAASFDVHRTPRAEKVQSMVGAVNGLLRRAGSSKAGRVGAESRVIRWWDSSTSGFSLAFTAFATAPLLLTILLFGFDVLA